MHSCQVLFCGSKRIEYYMRIEMFHVHTAKAEILDFPFWFFSEQRKCQNV